MPHPHRVHESRALRVFGRALHQPNLWHLNRHSVSRAMFLGLFWMLVPMPFQMVPATACAILARANLGITLVIVWISNPLTLAPMLWVCYLVGRAMLGDPATESPPFEWTWRSIQAHLGEIWQPLFLGTTTVGVGLGLLGYVGMQVLWRWHVQRRWTKRCRRRAETASPPHL